MSNANPAIGEPLEKTRRRFLFRKSFWTDRIALSFSGIGLVLMALTLMWHINPVEGSVVPRFLTDPDNLLGSILFYILFGTCIPTYILTMILAMFLIGDSQPGWIPEWLNLFAVATLGVQAVLYFLLGKFISFAAGKLREIWRKILFLAVVSLLFSISGSFSCAAAGAEATNALRPNIVFLLADDLGWGDLGCYGARDIRTPHLDRLARAGVRFTQFYANGPECTPTRAAFMTGRYQQRVGGLECAIGTGNVGRYDDAIRLAARHDLGLPATELTIARLLKNAGYATALIGKWHLGYEDKFAPSQHGFDHAFYCLGGGMDYFHHVEDPPAYMPVLRLEGKPVQRRGYFTELIAEDAVRWLREHQARDPQQPFFLYVPFTAPHSPYQAPNEEQPAPLPDGSPRWKQGQSPPNVYAAMVESMDTAVGRILIALDEHHLVTNTLVIFASDNGGTASARPCGLRGIKGMTFEGGIRVPCIVRWPGILPVGVDVQYPTLTFDLTASMAALAGVTPPKGRPYDGLDILRFIRSGSTPPGRAVFWRARRGESTWKAVREGALKYVSHIQGTQKQDYLFDIEHDLGEQHDLLLEPAATADRLKILLAAWEKEVQPTR